MVALVNLLDVFTLSKFVEERFAVVATISENANGARNDATKP